MYDPTIARFTGADPISDKFPHVSTYNYAENSPISNIDLHGLQAYSIHGTNSDPSTFNNLSDEDIQNLSGNQTVNRNFAWPEGTNGIANDQDNRSEAAQELAIHVLGSLAGGEDITLIGHSHGGNVAIQAVDLIQSGLDEAGDNRSISLVTIATPAYNGIDDPENPANTSVDSHTQFYSSNDAVQTSLSNMVGSKTPSRTFNNPGTNNVEVNDYRQIKTRIGTLRIYNKGPINSHFIQTNPDLLRKN